MNSKNDFKKSTNISSNIISNISVGLVSIVMGLGSPNLTYASSGSDNGSSNNINFNKIIYSGVINSVNSNNDIAYIVNLDDLVQLSNSDTIKKNLDVKNSVKTNVKSITKPNVKSAVKPVAKTEVKSTVKADVKKPTIYGGVEVNDLQKFSNAKLIGVDDASIDFYIGDDNRVTTYFAKGLLFELNDNKLLNIIANNSSFYVGQRYDISYYKFKKDITVKGSNILEMNMKSKAKFHTLINNDYGKMYDGALKEHELSRKNK